MGLKNFDQLLVIPTLYYPIFFLTTGLVYKLNVAQMISRAGSLWWPLLKRNFAFWLPVQFVQFAVGPDQGSKAVPPPVRACNTTDRRSVCPLVCRDAGRRAGDADSLSVRVGARVEHHPLRGVDPLGRGTSQLTND